jgi:hypothetical protein
MLKKMKIVIATSVVSATMWSPKGQNIMKYTTTQLETAVINAGDHFQSVYLEYVNDYLTISAFALDKNMTEKQARQQIEIGRKIHNQRTSK